ncbi:MAG TPA: hypoxanthine phosphoribosyltransferase [Candidatus Binataceae bacterium]|nr:hypoxanthine phosphoribosyltransferase [Candidatus Binataceae bacterium]
MNLEPRFTEDQIQQAVRRIAREISAAYGEVCPLLVGVLKGSFMFLADLVRELTIPFEVDFVLARSYGLGTKSSGKVEILKELESSVRERHVIVIEDIADTGLTLDTVVARIEAGEPASIRRCALLVREGHPPVDFAGLPVGPGFVVGYGIDYAERYRGLRDIRTLVEEPPS